MDDDRVCYLASSSPIILMITTALIVFILELVAWVITFLPSAATIPTSINDGIETIIGFTMPMEYFVPLTVVYLALSTFLVWEFLLYSWKGIRFVLRMVRGA
jgi:hypothetical protein